MPIYEYRCHGCGRDLELMQNINDNPLRKCPECGALKLQKLISAARFKLTGSGWYETDYKSKSEQKVEKDGDASSKSDVSAKNKDSKTSSAGETKTESKASKKDESSNKVKESSTDNG